MTTGEIIASVIAGLSLVVSLYTAYRTIIARFSGKCWPAARIVLTHMDGIPAIGLACFFDNVGARPGILDDLRLTVKHRESGATYAFFPQLTRDDYSVFASYSGPDWFPFSGISLPAHERAERYILFKPLNDKFTAQEGYFEASLEVRWYKGKKWNIAPPGLHFKLDAEVAKRWNDSVSSAVQVLSDDLLAHRKIIA